MAQPGREDQFEQGQRADAHHERRTVPIAKPFSCRAWTSGITSAVLEYSETPNRDGDQDGVRLPAPA
jgi:hypothetical protein